MNPKYLAAYADFRRTVFDAKIDGCRTPFVAPEEQLLKAASSMGRAQGLTPLEGGSTSTCWRFDTADGSYVLRIPTSEQFAPSLIVEDWAARAAAEVHFPAVIPILTDTSRYLVPFSYQILPFVEGEPESAKTGWLARLGQIHLRGYGPLDPRIRQGAAPEGLFKTWQDYLTCQLDEHLDFCIKSGAMTDHEAENADDLIRGLRVDFDPVLLHNDLSPRNVIGGMVIDWDSCLAGDPVYDLASMLAFHADTPVEPLIRASYVKDADIERRFWVYYLRISIARTVRRAKAQLPEDPRYPKASARIQLALSHLS